MTTLNDKLKYFSDWQAKIVLMNQELRNEAEKYKAEMKKEFGITDGEQMDVLSVVKAMSKLKELE